MLDNRLQYAIMATEDRIRDARHHREHGRGAKRIFRLGSGRSTSRDGRR
jgi:hypothetical protein